MANYKAGQEGMRCCGAFLIIKKEYLSQLKKGVSPPANHCRLRSMTNGGGMNDWCELTSCPVRGLLFEKSKPEQMTRLAQFRKWTADYLTTLGPNYTTQRKQISLKQALIAGGKDIIWK